MLIVAIGMYQRCTNISVPINTYQQLIAIYMILLIMCIVYTTIAMWKMSNGEANRSTLINWQVKDLEMDLC